MSALLDHLGEFIEDRYPEWTDAQSPLPAPPSLITLERFLSLETPGADLAVQLPNTVDVTSLPESVLGCPLLTLSFPSFADGRAYSQARLLSREPRFAGSLRATGAAVVFDQLVMLRRCGIDQFQLRPDQNPDLCATILRTLHR